MQTIWKGAINFGLVNVPVKMFSATQDNDIPMKMLHKEYSVPIHYVRTCPKCEKDVNWNEIVKGYEYEPGHFVTFDKEELNKLASEDTKQIKILDFVDLEEIDPIYYQKTYYLAPDNTGTTAYNLLLDALEATNKIGIANVTIRNKSSLAAIRIVKDCLAMSTMFYAEEIRPVDQVPNLPKRKEPNGKELEMAKMLIEQLSSKFEPEKYEDEYKKPSYVRHTRQNRGKRSQAGSRREEDERHRSDGCAPGQPQASEEKKGHGAGGKGRACQAETQASGQSKEDGGLTDAAFFSSDVPDPYGYNSPRRRLGVPDQMGRIPGHNGSKRRAGGPVFQDDEAEQ